MILNSLGVTNPRKHACMHEDACDLKRCWCTQTWSLEVLDVAK